LQKNQMKSSHED